MGPDVNRLARELGAPPRTFFGRVLRYAVAGGLATLIYFGAVTGLVELANMRPVLAAGVGTVLVMVTSYVINRTWVFDTNRSHASAFSRFVTASIVSLALNTSLMYVSVELFGWSYLVGLVITTAVVPPTNFVINYFWCFSTY